MDIPKRHSSRADNLTQKPGVFMRGDRRAVQYTSGLDRVRIYPDPCEKKVSILEPLAESQRAMDTSSFIIGVRINPDPK
jgi:hypothetical protein